MRLVSFLSPADAERAGTTLRKLQRHGGASLVLAGGFASEMHCIRIGLEPMIRTFNDIDFLTGSFNEIPVTLAADFLFRHVHPHDQPGKTLMQAVDPETAVRIDVFRAYGMEMDRAVVLEGTDGGIRIISLEDLVARTGRLCLDIASDMPIAGKHARDFLRLLPMIESPTIETVWREHRKSFHPESFREAASLLSRLIPARIDLQIGPVYSRDFESKCIRCEATAAFPLADGRRIVSLLGYC